MNNKKMLGNLLLLLTAMIWGTAFVAQTAASDTVSAFTFNASRSVLAAVFLFLIVLFRNKIGKEGKYALRQQLAGSLNRIVFLGMTFPNGSV